MAHGLTVSVFGQILAVHSRSAAITRSVDQTLSVRPGAGGEPAHYLQFERWPQEMCPLGQV
jgi:hypothetical protein